MLEKDFLLLSEKKLIEMSDLIESRDKDSIFEVEYADGILSITIFAQENKNYVINRHSGNQKIWFSSPISGADYFAYDQAKQQWLNNKGQEIWSILSTELANFK